MKIRDYSSFYREIGKLEGVASVSSDLLKNSLLESVESLKTLFETLTVNVITTPEKPTTAHSGKELGGVKRPSPEEVNKTPQEKAEEEAFEPIFHE